MGTGGMGLISVAKPMIQNVFADAMPLLVTSAFASAYLMAMAAGNLGGRIGWAAISDKIGRRNTFHCYTLGSIPIFGSLPFLINECVTNPSGPLAPYYLSAFCVSSVAAITILGGTFAVLPAYEADLYGPKYVGAIHGRFLLAASLSTELDRSQDSDDIQADDDNASRHRRPLPIPVQQHNVHHVRPGRGGCSAALHGETCGQEVF